MPPRNFIACISDENRFLNEVRASMIESCLSKKKK
jgi:hypothetical protein